MKLVGIAAIIVALAVGYYFVIYLPEKDKAQEAAAQQAAQKAQQKIALDACLSSADTTYTTNWNSACKSNGLDKKTDGCTLPADNANEINNSRTQARDDCFKEFPQN